MPKIALGALSVVALAGWALAGVFWNQSQDLAEQIENAAINRAELTEELGSARDLLKDYSETTGLLGDIQEKAEAAEKRAATLEQQLVTAREELRKVTEETEARRGELAEIDSELLGRQAKIAEFEGEIDKAANQLTKLRAEAEELGRKVEPLRVELANLQTSGSSASTPAKPLAALPTGSDKIAEAKRRFDAVDQNGDGKVDEFEFRFNSINLFELVDTNRDGSITMEETLMSPQAFQRLEPDSEGKLSVMEFADVNTFRQLDTKNQGYIVFEDIVDLFKSASQ